MVETINIDPSVEIINKTIDNFNVPVVFVENNDNQSITIEQNQRATDHYAPSVRVVYVNKHGDGNNGFGFHLSRSKWDPYPYVSSVDTESSANTANLKEGDCVLEVNGEDVLGMRISDVANMVKSKGDHVTLLLWNTNLDQSCESNLCCGPMPINYEKLAAIMQTILTSIECPVCLNTIPTPFTQCQNGHLVCMQCRARSERCPICRDRYSVVRCLLAEQIYSTLIETFNLHEGTTGKIREKIFGARACKPEEKSSKAVKDEMNSPKIHSHTQKFLAKIMGKSSSMDNISKESARVMPDNLLLKNKSLSLSQSTSNIFRPDASQMAVIRCPSMNRLGSELSNSCGSLIGLRRPKSCNGSSESLPCFPPTIIIEENVYCCPGGEECTERELKESLLVKHINEQHKLPTITFGSSSAEISLPPRAPIENASLIMLLDGIQFWVKCVADSSNNLFISCLMQSSQEFVHKYVLEIIIRKSADKILGMELINRNEIYCLETTSWKDVLENKRGISFTNESIQTMFTNAEVSLKATIKRIEDI
ncbi:unnamed protein product [Diamesa serratosioi]